VLADVGVQQFREMALAKWVTSLKQDFLFVEVACLGNKLQQIWQLLIILDVNPRMLESWLPLRLQMRFIEKINVGPPYVHF
jgi:hypothetical protein